MNWAISPTLDLFVIFLLNLFTSVLCMWVFWLPESMHHVSAWCPQRPEKGHRVPWDWCCGWVGTAMRVLRTEPESSGGAADVLNHWAVSSSFSFTFFFNNYFLCVYVCGWVHTCYQTHVEVRGQLRASFSPATTYVWGSAQVIGLGRKCLYPLNHFAILSLFLNVRLFFWSWPGLPVSLILECASWYISCKQSTEIFVARFA